MGFDSKTLRGSSKQLALEEALAIGGQNIKDIKRSDVVLAILDGADVDSGTSAEIGYACGIGKLVIGYRGDFRAAPDASSCKVNLQVETFIRKSNGSIYDTVDEALAHLVKGSKPDSKSKLKVPAHRHK
jgi:nucleoside 2-deoxyribosyltransferase